MRENNRKRERWKGSDIVNEKRDGARKELRVQEEKREAKTRER